MNLEQQLYYWFGYRSFREGQREIIENVRRGNNVLAMLPTGTGKSLCYQLPAFMFPGVTIVVSPLLALMEDQVQQLKANGMKQVVALNSFLNGQEKREVLSHLHQYKMIYVSPEILQSPQVSEAISRLTVSLFVVDEAHCISQWGHEFRTDYLKLAQVKERLGDPVCLAITATATDAAQKDILYQLNMSEAVAHIYSVDRPNIALDVQHVSSVEEKIARLTKTVKNLQKPGMIYFSSRKWAEKITAHMKREGVKNVAYYHGGLSTEDRLMIQQQFLNDQLDVICCTNAFGMGINKSNIRFVIHFHYPSQIESYLQEIGRAGRDGQASIAILFHCDDDRYVPRSLLEREFPEDEQIDQVFTYLENSRGWSKMSPEEFGLTETGGRFLMYHLSRLGLTEHDQSVTSRELRKAKHQMKEVILDRKMKKSSKLQEMETWLQTTDCRRKQILAYFGEAIGNRPNNCCDHCSIDMGLYKSTSYTRQETHFQDWRQELKQLLHQQ